MDRGIDWIVGAPDYPEFEEPANDRAAAWPEVMDALRSGEEATRFRYAPERTPLLSATRVVDLARPEVMLMTLNARDITRPVRAQRFRLAVRSEERTSELQSLMRTSYAVFCLEKQND